MLPRRSSSVCSLMAALVVRNGAQANSDKHKSMVEASSAYTVALSSTAKGSPAYSGRAIPIRCWASAYDLSEDEFALVHNSFQKLKAAEGAKFEIRSSNRHQAKAWISL